MFGENQAITMVVILMIVVGREPQDGGVYVSKLNWTLRSIS